MNYKDVLKKRWPHLALIGYNEATGYAGLVFSTIETSNIPTQAEFEAALAEENSLDEYRGSFLLNITGDAVGQGVSNVHVDFTDSGVVPGTYNGVVVDAKGRVTDGTVGFPWASITGIPAILPDLSLSVSVPATSGTSVIPLDNTTPLVTEGTQIAQVTCTPSSPESKMGIQGSLVLDCSSTNRNIVLAAFRGTVCIGATVLNFISPGRPQTLSFSFVDPATGQNFGTSPIAYSLRIGVATSGTWYVNRLATNYLNGMLALNRIFFWEYI